MSSEIKQAADALIAAIDAAIQRIPRGIGAYAAEEQFYAACRRMEERIGKACFQVKERRSPEEQAHASRMWADKRLAEAKAQRKVDRLARAERAARRAEQAAQAEAAREAWFAEQTRRVNEAEQRRWANEAAERTRPPAAELAALKAAMAAAHPDRGGTSEAFIAAHRRYREAKAQRARP